MSENDVAHWRQLAARDQAETRERRINAFIDEGDVDLDDDEFEDAVYELGLREYDEGWQTADYQLVIDGVEKLASVGQANVDHYFDMVAATIMLGRFEEALDTALDYLSGDPNDDEDLQRLAVLCLDRLGRTAEALTLVAEYLADRDDDPLLWQIEARILRQLGRAEEASISSDRARELIGSDPGHTWAIQSARAAAAGNQAGAEVYRRLTALITEVEQRA